ncbi:vomeronasal type-2 receptor 26-like [Hyperolius riggenbachi]|uniref:vomeronasal type-2 receptor 26-like n=1 Tax=Hyperolius riggenbachi TaxID=752182 RepID=UPI0035A339B5
MTIQEYKKNQITQHSMSTSIDLDGYTRILGMIFAVDEIKHIPAYLSNVTLGYNIFSTCGIPTQTLGYVLQILSGEKIKAPNYSCREHGEVAGFIGDTSVQSNYAMAQLLSLYRYTHINYDTTDPLLSDRKMFPTLYRLLQDDRIRYAAIIKCLLHFGWNWVGMVAPSDNLGEVDLRGLSKMMTRHGICIEYVLTFTGDFKKNNKYNIELHRYVGIANYEDSLSKQELLNVEAKTLAKLFIANWVFHKRGTRIFHNMTLLTSFSDNGDIEDAINFRPENITWKEGKVPEFRCNARCPPGYRKVPTESIHICCYDCIPCSEGEVSNVTDSESCFKCPEKEWPDEKKVNCVSKIYEYLSYDNDVLSLIFLCASVMLLAITLFVLGNFIYYWDTPIVKANNRTVSFILLTSNFLSFLCVFLFLGRPVDITCMLRQVSFGVFFSIAVASVLAKTVTVCIAFKATKPGSYWRKWAGVKVSNFLVLICSFGQVLICVIWLSVSPPYQEYDMHSYPGKIIVQCNEGSVIGFYSVLGYMGFLAAVSFLLAFMVRTLPDSFNEAKYITFSMLVFCSVWIAMIPAYLSTRGKYMVAVEVFAILTSSAGILACIFFPKCYIMLLKPELNTKKEICSRK